MPKLLKILYTVPATCGISFEIEASHWASLSDENKEIIMLHYAQKADGLLYNGELDDLGEGIGCNAHIKRLDGIDMSTVEVDSLDFDEAAYEEGTRYERAFGDGSDVS